MSKITPLRDFFNCSIADIGTASGIAGFSVVDEDSLICCSTPPKLDPMAETWHVMSGSSPKDLSMTESSLNDTMLESKSRLRLSNNILTSMMCLVKALQKTRCCCPGFSSSSSAKLRSHSACSKMASTDTQQTAFDSELQSLTSVLEESMKALINKFFVD